MGGRLRKRWPAFLLTLSLALVLVAAPAQAAFPGQNGKIAFGVGSGASSTIQTIEPDGTNQTVLRQGSEPAWSPSGQEIAFRASGALWKAPAGGGDATNVAGDVHDPSWSPDGTRIAFAVAYLECHDCELYRWIATVAANGGDGQLVSYEAENPAWSPDGSEIAFGQRSSSICCSGPTGGPTEPGVYAIRPDGSGLRRIVPFGKYPNWSPDGSKIVFSGASAPFSNGIWVVNAIGGTPVLLFDNGSPAYAPAWSPDGTNIVFNSSLGITVMNADGSNPTGLTSGSLPDWQPIPVNAYPRPAGAYPMRVSLVPAYQPCSAPNRTHGPPLGFGSCNPPAQEPGQLTVGTPDANGQGAKSVGSLRITTLTGNPATTADEADVSLRANITDVRMRSDLSDYTGDLEARLRIQITDKNNTPHPGGPGAATVQELTHSQPIPCAGTANETVGSTCQLNTTVEALVPGAVVEKRRAIWELGAIRVHDGAGNLFMTQGLFVP